LTLSPRGTRLNQELLQIFLKQKTMKRIMTIAGSDSGGGAGIQADLKTITLLGGFGMTVLTALTAQNTKEVRAIHSVPPRFIAQQLDAILSDIGADAAKTGMLFHGPAIEAVADRLSAHQVPHLVVDPVMVAKGGDTLLVKEARETLVKRLLPMAFIITPNIPETEFLSNRPIRGEGDIHECARIIHAMGAKHVLIKGGHLEGPARDVLFDGKDFWDFTRDRINTPHTHGTGCVYSAAIATYLAMGAGVQEAVEQAKTFVHSAIRFGLPLGEGHGPANPYAHFAREKERYRVLEALKEGLGRLKEAAVGELIPEVQSNLAYGLPFAASFHDVAAFPGRIVRLGKGVATVSGPAFGASRHLATVVLTAMGHNPEFRSAMNVAFSDSRIARCRALGWRIGSFDRAQEPRDIKEREGGTLEWGTEHVLSQVEKVPDAIFDRGEVGKEPMMRILGRTPQEVVEKVIQLQGAEG
jgi:hydroxymethylpyrimidine/phosphomethylpyrimidine kinase